MRKRILKTLIALCCILVLLLPSALEVIAKPTAGEGQPQTFGAVHLHTSSYLNGSSSRAFGYKVDNRKVYRINSGTDSPEGYDETILCLDEYGLFPSEANGAGQYINRGEATTSKISALQTKQNGVKKNIEKAAEVLWIMNNAVLPEDSPELKDVKLAKIFAEALESTKDTQNPLTLDYIKGILTEDDLVFAAQTAIWGMTNAQTNHNYQGTTNGASYNGLDGNDPINHRGLQGTYLHIMIEYYKTHAGGDNIVDPSTSGKVKPKVVKPEEELLFASDSVPGDNRGIVEGNYIFVGPFSIEPEDGRGTTIDYTVHISFKDEGGNVMNGSDVSYYIMRNPSTTGGRLSPTKESLGEGTDFYIALNKRTTVREVVIDLKSAAMFGDSHSTLWTVEGRPDMQPLISVRRAESTIETKGDSYRFQVNFEREHDISLRKFITAIKRPVGFGDWQVIDVANRAPQEAISSSVVKFNQYEYKHKKDPIAVQKGDVVRYKIRVLNEGKYPVKIMQVVDYLPLEGLEFIDPTKPETIPEDYTSFVDTKGGYTATETKSSDTRLVTINGNKDVPLEPGETVSSGKCILNTVPGRTDVAGVTTKINCVEMELDFLVTEEAQGKILTNIAEVTEFKAQAVDAAGESKGNYVTQKDIDSTVKNLTLPNNMSTEWESYKGSTLTIQDLTRSDYYYFGQEDDDDFEKVYIPGGIDIALRKSITKVNTTPITTRMGRIDPSPIKPPKPDPNRTTSDFNDDKTKMKVQVGDKIVYTIRVFNEGEEDAFAAKVTDYIPEGLGYLKNYRGNKDNGWENKTSTATKVKLSEIPGAVNNFSAEDFSGGASDYKDEEVICGKATVETEKLAAAEYKLSKFDPSKAEMPVVELEITCVVLDSAKGKEAVKNIAAITKYKNKSGTDVTRDKDSVPNNDLTNFKDDAHEDDEDFEQVYVEGDPIYDLALKKYVAAVQDEDENTKTIPNNRKRVLTVTDVSQLKNRNSRPEKKADAIYSFAISSKESLPVEVAIDDIVTYSIRVYNEGNIDAKVGQIVDTVPEQLTFLEDSDLNDMYGWEAFNEPGASGRKTGIRTDYLKDTVLKAFDESKEGQRTDAAQKNPGLDNGVSYGEVFVQFKVNDTAKPNEKIKNIAEITADDGDDNDSIPNNENPPEDDEDFDFIIPVETPTEPPYDVALKKYVSSLSDATNTSKDIATTEKRELTVTNVDDLIARGEADNPAEVEADAVYDFKVNKNSTPVTVEKGDYVVYTIRIYNEGLKTAKIEEILDSVPDELTFLPDSEINKKYRWHTYSDPSNSGWKTGIKTDYLKDTEIPAFDQSKKGQSTYDKANGIGMDNGVSFAEVLVEFKVNDKAVDGQRIKNLAEITGDEEEEDSDPDSDPDNQDESEDDEDFDVIVPGTPPPPPPPSAEYDLALRKFLTKIGDTEIKDRVPVVDTTELDSGKSKTAKYTHPKQEDTKVVVKGQVVVFTLRIYNEGSGDAYASKIQDDIPDGLKFLPDHEVNKKYKWQTADASGNPTTDASKIKMIVTDYGKRENGIEKSGGDPTNPYYKSNTNLIRAYDPTKMKQGPDFIDVEVAFEVIKSNVTDGKPYIINTAEIKEERDPDGNIVKDRDSTPGNDDPKEDDIDKEYLKLKYFDLSLLKFVSKVIVTEDGVTKTTKTNYTGKESPEPIVKVELNRKKLATTTVKFEYTIKITNEGEIEGYAKEITDRIPTGLEFYAEDNKAYGWVSKGNNVITTDYLKDKLLKPGESANVLVVLRWKRDANNLKTKINVAEISKDYNEYGVPDIDSKPGNNVPSEDDQDEAPVLLSIATGAVPLYITLIIVTTSILGVGFYLIYKYVIKR